MIVAMGCIQRGVTRLVIIRRSTDSMYRSFAFEPREVYPSPTTNAADTPAPILA